MAGKIFTLAPRLRTLNLLHGGVDDATLIRVHRLQGGIATGLYGAGSHLSAEIFKRFLALFAVIAHVQCNAVIRLVHMVCNERRKILEGIQCFAAVADDEADIFAGEHKLCACLFLADLNIYVAEAHAGKNVAQILCCGVCRCGTDERAHLCRSAAEKAEALFLFRFENFKLCVCGVYAQHCACFFIRFFCGCACCDCFFYHGFLLPFFFSILYLYPVSE